MALWAKIDAGFFRNPKVRKAGRDGREVYLWLLLVNRAHDFNGTIPANYADPKYIAREIEMRPYLVAAALSRCVAAQLIAVSPRGDAALCGWDGDWRTKADDSRERVRKHRANKAETIEVGNGVGNACNAVTPLEESRGEQSRGEERSSQVAGGALDDPPPVEGGTDKGAEPGNPGTDPPGVPAKAKPEPSDEAKACAQHLLEAIRSHTPDFEGRNVAGWSRDLDLAIRIDKRTPEQLNKAADWVHRSPAGAFWRANVLSGKKLRAQFDTLRIQARERSSGLLGGALPPYGKPRGLTGDDLLEAAARMRAEEEKQHGNE